MLDLTQEQQLQNTVDELLRVEKTRKVGEVCGVIAALAVGIGYGVAGLPILSIALMAVVAEWVVEFIADGIAYTVLKPNGKLEPEKQQLQNTMDELLRVEKAKKVGKVCSVIAALVVGIGCGVAGLPMSLIAFVAVVAGWVVEFIANNIAYAVLKPGGKLEPEKQQLQNTIDELLRVEKAKKTGKVSGVAAMLVVGIGCGVAGLPMPFIALMAFAAGWAVEYIADGITYAISKPSGKLEEEACAQQQKSGNLTEEQRLQNAIDKLLRVEKAKEIGEVCGCITILAVSIGCGVAGLPISSIALMAFAAGWTVGLVADGITYAVSKPSDKLDELNLRRVENRQYEVHYS